MRSLLSLMLLTGCAPPRMCPLCAPSPAIIAVSSIAGPFEHRVEAVDTIEGRYEPPVRTTEWVTTSLRVEENFVIGELPGVPFAVRIVSHFDIEITESTECCAPQYRILPETRTWQEEAYMRVDYGTELGGFPSVLDPSLAYVEPLTFDWLASVPDSYRPHRLDEDGGGFVVDADYYVRPADCVEAACASRVRVRHHFRRPVGP